MMLQQRLILCKPRVPSISASHTRHCRRTVEAAWARVSRRLSPLLAALAPLWPLRRELTPLRGWPAPLVAAAVGAVAKQRIPGLASERGVGVHWRGCTTGRPAECRGVLWLFSCMKTCRTSSAAGWRSGL